MSHVVSRVPESRSPQRPNDEEFTYTSAGPETFECTASGSFVGHSTHTVS